MPDPQKFHFISGLPRSGSTLLAALLRQNRRFHAAMSSPVAPLVNSALEQMGANSEFYSFFSTEKRKSVSRALFEAYYADRAEKNVIFDTNRIWTARLHQLVELFGDFKMICCVRNPAWIMDSFERIYRKNPFEYSRMFNTANRVTVYSRCDAMINTGGVVGSAWTALKEAYYGEFSSRLLLVDYDLLTQRPLQALELIYRFIDEPIFDHDVDNVEYEEGEFDQQLGVKDLHTVKRKVEFFPRRTILPPDLFERFSEMDFWRDINGTAANLIAPKN